MNILPTSNKVDMALDYPELQCSIPFLEKRRPQGTQALKVLTKKGDSSFQLSQATCRPLSLQGL